MKDHLLELIEQESGINAKLNKMREYLQAYILRIMHDEGAFRTMAFLGGTALRFLYDLPRFSEDLDFSTVKNIHFDFNKLIKKIENELALSGYSVSASYKDQKTVYSAFIKFEGLLYEGGISALKSQKFSIKIDIDTKPPQGAILKTRIVNKYFPISFLFYDIPSLFSGKLHALFCRKFIKGRDFFDLGWYLSRWKDISPNIVLLENALKQTEWKNDFPSKDNWRNMTYEIVQKADWKKIESDIGNLLENPRDINIFTQQNLLSLILPEKT